MIQKLNEIPVRSLPRYSTGLEGLDKILGGGLVEGVKILFGGTQGAGKSTLLLQVAQKLAEKRKKILYVAGEENSEQIRLRATRLEIDSGKILISDEVEVKKMIEAYWEYKPDLIIVDSLQTAFSLDLKPAPAPGTPTQMKNALLKLCDLARKENVAVIFVAHSTKGNFIQGANFLKHMVDIVLYLKKEEGEEARVLKVEKSRFGKSDEIWEVKMTSEGLKGKEEEEEEEEEIKNNGNIDYIWPYKLEPEKMDELCVEHPVWGTMVKSVARWLGKEMAVITSQ